MKILLLIFIVSVTADNRRPNEHEKGEMFMSRLIDTVEQDDYEETLKMLATDLVIKIDGFFKSRKFLSRVLPLKGGPSIRHYVANLPNEIVIYLDYFVDYNGIQCYAKYRTSEVSGENRVLKSAELDCPKPEY